MLRFLFLCSYGQFPALSRFDICSNKVQILVTTRKRANASFCFTLFSIFKKARKTEKKRENRRKRLVLIRIMRTSRRESQKYEDITSIW